MRSYRKRQVIKIFKTTRAKAKRLYSLCLTDKSYNRAFVCADRVHGRAFGSIMYHSYKIISEKIEKSKIKKILGDLQ